MKKIWQLLGLPSLKKGNVGIEIECEGTNLQVVQTDFWDTTHDGSLRGRFPDESSEFVLKGPIAVAKVKSALEALAAAQAKAKLNFSFRTSVHVHINVQDLTHIQLVNLVYTYLLIEEPLINFCGKERKGNRFCLRLQDAEGLLEYVAFLIQNDVKDLRVVNENQLRYAALNLGALTKYGSVEFRSMRGTLDVSTISTWVSALIQLRNYACAAVSPKEIYEEFCNIGCVAFLNKVLGDYAKPFHYPKMEKDLHRSFSLSIDIPFLYKMHERNFQICEE